MQVAHGAGPALDHGIGQRPTGVAALRAAPVAARSVLFELLDQIVQFGNDLLLSLLGGFAGGELR